MTATAGELLRVGMVKMPFRSGVTGSRRFIQSLSETEAFHKSVDGPHWYLVAVGGRDECHGRAGVSARGDGHNPCGRDWDAVLSRT